MVVSCEIIFDENTNGTYYAGQLVTGNVVLKANKSKEVKGVILKVAGYGKTKFYRGRTTYKGREDFMSSVAYVLGSEENDRSTIEAGVHTYTFACQLPYDCPSSFEGTFGCIRYLVKVTLTRPWKFDQSYARGFTVLKLLDLNNESPALRAPASMEDYKTFCCVRGDSLKLEVTLPQTGYVSGQKIPVHALVINNSSVPISQLKYSLIMRISYHSQWPLKDVHVQHIDLTKIKGQSVLRNCTRSITEELFVPATPPTCEYLSKLIQIHYEVEVRAIASFWHSDHVITVPLTIGNVPIWNDLMLATCSQQRKTEAETEPEPEPSTESEKSREAAEKQKSPIPEGTEHLPSSPSAPPAPVEPTTSRASRLYHNLQPPCYEEAMHTRLGDIDEDEQHGFGPVEFAPLYPVFSLSTDKASAQSERPSPSGAYNNPSYQN